MNKKYLLLVMVLLLVPFSALAQTMDAFDLHVASLKILERKDVQAELGITPAQRAKMDHFADGYNTDLKVYLQTKQNSAPRDYDPMRDQSIIAMLARLKQNVMSVLTPAQLRRLREISLQAFGLNGIMDSEVAKKIGLSDDQVKRLIQTYEAGSKKANGIMASAMEPVNNKYKPKSQAEAASMKPQYIKDSKAAMNAAAPQMQKVNDDTQKAMLAIITPDQRKQFLALQGKVFHSKPSASKSSTSDAATLKKSKGKSRSGHSGR